jgi:hypothetical protein
VDRSTFGVDEVPMNDQGVPDHGPPSSDPVADADSSGAPAVSREEAELLAAFDRLRPQGSVGWAFDDALRRVDQPDQATSAIAYPWKGLPDDLWERGRSARVGQRLMGDVAAAMADVLAADARLAADAAVNAVNGGRFAATWQALQYLAARVAALESKSDPLGLEAAEWPEPPPDQTAWLDAAALWFADVDRQLPIIVGESGDGAIVGALARDGRRVRGVEPRGASVWRSFRTAEGEGTGGEGTGGDTAEGEGTELPGSAPAGETPEFVLDHVDRYLRAVPDQSVGGVVLIGGVDRTDLPGKLELLEHAIRVTVTGGTVVVLAEDQSAWEASLSHPARDLASGRPLHPETWSFLLRRSGVADPQWHSPTSGDLHAVAARVDR